MSPTCFIFHFVLREEFLKNKDVADIRMIDMLVIKGQMELKESVKIWKQKSHVMRWWKETHESKPTDFLSKFLAGQQ
jgi:NADH dehydrogenase (ubiquinone) 1 alpha subcomplex subunit 6